MSKQKTDYNKLVKELIRLRLMESGWTYNLHSYIQNKIISLLDAGNKNIKFNELYGDVITRARLAVPIEMEEEFHQKICEYLSVNLEDTSVFPVSSNDVDALSSVFSLDPSSVPPSVLIHDPSSVLPFGISDISSLVPSDIPSDVISNDDD